MVIAQSTILVALIHLLCDAKKELLGFSNTKEHSADCQSSYNGCKMDQVTSDKLFIDK